ncbi:DUF167 domain-containing protein [Sphingosinicella sp. LY1275]|uniref:DUF167 domain-containing protein n=1 Tax=Sphingosinicella sp. LY1275 TaxID=3095379 RepID=UPI002ADEE082|nr:DUF167 family protein [Sphingosinicella sp. LY1275]MEA1013604.1 DUF167 family protein [Sphingosinicella sp. LY1275]
MSGIPFAIEDGGVRLAVRLTPRAKRDAIGGVSEDAEGRPVLVLRLAAPPVDGAANKALIAFLAKALAIPKSSITIRSGETARQKMLFLVGDGEAIARKLAALVTAG